MNRKTGRGYTLVEIMIVVIIFGVLLAIALPNFYTARTQSRTKAVMENLKQIDGAKDQFVMEHSLVAGDSVNDGTDLAPNYIASWPTGPIVGTYVANPVGTDPTFNGQNSNWYNQHCNQYSPDTSCPL